MMPRIAGMMLALGASLAMGSPVTVSTGGTWGGVGSSSAYFASNEPWTLSFQVDNPPVLFSVSALYFDTFYSNAVYTLNQQVVSLSGEIVSFEVGGDFDFCLDLSCDHVISPLDGSPLLFSGPTSNPILVPGSYTTTLGTSFTALDYKAQAGPVVGVTPGNGTVLIMAQTSSTPEPGGLALIGAGLAALGIARWRMMRKS